MFTFRVRDIHYTRPKKRGEGAVEMRKVAVGQRDVCPGGWLFGLEEQRDVRAREGARGRG